MDILVVLGIVTVLIFGVYLLNKRPNKPQSGVGGGGGGKDNPRTDKK